ncbi:MAG: hypothetical protein H9847_08535 [Candidatus Anaerobiospirillum pullicola]|uniref:Uncharacterized protein n=1 Tax=Candidatus Anaerobiospirillum pullicola TaxID=2838451 RepID=A0A948TH10_9GAMM|nr:hypothetical protein [Candidatus Anaerobiospirillum pullicola]
MRSGFLVLVALLALMGVALPLWGMYSSGAWYELWQQYGLLVLVTYVVGLVPFVLITVLTSSYRLKSLLTAIYLLALTFAIIIGPLSAHVSTQLSLGAVVCSVIAWRLFSLWCFFHYYLRAMQRFAQMSDLDSLEHDLAALARRRVSTSLWVNISGYLITFHDFLTVVIPFKRAFDGDFFAILQLQQAVQGREAAYKQAQEALSPRQRWWQRTFGAHSHLQDDFLHVLDNMLVALKYFNYERHKLREAALAPQSAEVYFHSSVASTDTDVAPVDATPAPASVAATAVSAGATNATAGATVAATVAVGQSVPTGQRQGVSAAVPDNAKWDEKLEQRLASNDYQLTAEQEQMLQLVLHMLWMMSAENPNVQRTAAAAPAQRIVNFEVGTALLGFVGVWRVEIRYRLLAMVWPFICFFLSLLALWGLLQSANVTALFELLGAFTDSERLLSAYSLWLSLLLLTVFTGLVLMVASMGLTGIEPYLRQHALKIQLMMLVLYVLLAGTFVLKGGAWHLFWQVHADLEQVAQGTEGLEQSQVFLSPKVLVTNIGEPMGSDFKTVRRFGGIGEDTGNRWEIFRLPRDVWLPWDPLHVFNEKKSVTWNYDNARQYLLFYTSNLHIVVYAQQVPFTSEQVVKPELLQRLQSRTAGSATVTAAPDAEADAAGQHTRVENAMPASQDQEEQAQQQPQQQYRLRMNFDDIVERLQQQQKPLKPQLPQEHVEDAHKSKESQLMPVSEAHAADRRDSLLPSPATMEGDAADDDKPWLKTEGPTNYEAPQPVHPHADQPHVLPASTTIRTRPPVLVPTPQEQAQKHAQPPE